MADLSVKFGGVEFKNPVWTASLSPAAPFTTFKDAADIVLKTVKKCYDHGLGAYTTGSIMFEEPKYEWRGKARNMVMRTRGFAEREGDVGMSVMPDASYPRTIGLELLSKIKKECPEMGLVANICGPGVDPKGWGALAADTKQAGADLVELNVCTFMVFDSIAEAVGDIVKREEYPAGIMAGLVPEVTARIIAGIKAVTDIPIIVKIPPELPVLRLIPGAGMYLRAGAKGVTCSHLFLTVPPPDIYKRGRPAIPFMDKVSFFGVCGPTIRQTACYRNVAAVAKYFTPAGLDVAACGGLVIPEHIIEAMMLGAKAVQLSSGLRYGGLSFISQVLEFMNKYMDEQGFKKVDDFIGMGLNYFVDFREFMEWWNTHPVVAKIDYVKCTKCGTCLDNLCFATYWEDGKPKVDPRLCGSCNICVPRCSSGARSLVPVKVAGKMPHWLGDEV